MPRTCSFKISEAGHAAVFCPDSALTNSPFCQTHHEVSLRQSRFATGGKKAAGKRKKSPEFDYQAYSVVPLLRAYQRVNPNFIFLGMPPLNQLSAQARKKQTQSGYMAGWPDLTLVNADRFAFLELKSKDGRLSPKQVLVQDFCKRNSVPFFVASAPDLDAVHKACDAIGLTGVRT